MTNMQCSGLGTPQIRRELCLHATQHKGHLQIKIDENTFGYQNSWGSVIPV